MSRARRTDDNHTELVDALRDDQVSVTSTAMVGGGFVDLVVGVDGLTITGDERAIGNLWAALHESPIPGLVIHRGANFLVEVKDGKKAAGKQALTPDEKKWHYGWTQTFSDRRPRNHPGWRGQKAICNSLDAIFRLLGRTRKEL
jgi:hypothetical protein